MFKAIFLDIDGVLNCGSTKERSPSKVVGIDNKKVKLLKEIVDKTNARIVLCSSWRKDVFINSEDGNYLREELKKEGLEIDNITTMNGDNLDRGWQVVEYIKLREIESYVILDDEFESSYKNHKIDSHLVLTKYEDGLTEENVKEAIKILSKKEK